MVGLQLMALTHAKIYEIVACLLTCIFNQQPDLNFLKAFKDYFSDTANFSSQSMALDMMKKLYDDWVCGVCLWEFKCPTNEYLNY